MIIKENRQGIRLEIVLLLAFIVSIIHVEAKKKVMGFDHYVIRIANCNPQIYIERFKSEVLI